MLGAGAVAALLATRSGWEDSASMLVVLLGLAGQVLVVPLIVGGLAVVGVAALRDMAGRR